MGTYEEKLRKMSNGQFLNEVERYILGRMRCNEYAIIDEMRKRRKVEMRGKIIKHEVRIQNDQNDLLLKKAKQIQREQQALGVLIGIKRIVKLIERHNKNNIKKEQT